MKKFTEWLGNKKIQVGPWKQSLFFCGCTPGEYICAFILCSQLRQLRLKQEKWFVQEQSQGQGSLKERKICQDD
ncbi:hypothetical protein CR201_G0002659 [Pongo abelii]|uniref:Uncharacterized protein n=1 Tax=Pongo abelii TaxID=9601 RepID=A0A2J8XE12_PONAB|nr:hypothetical protein CR201_G0002659 [Pongo abelii]